MLGPDKRPLLALLDKDAHLARSRGVRDGDGALGGAAQLVEGEGPQRREVFGVALNVAGRVVALVEIRLARVPVVLIVDEGLRLCAASVRVADVGEEQRASRRRPCRLSLDVGGALDVDFAVAVGVGENGRLESLAGVAEG